MSHIWVPKFKILEGEQQGLNAQLAGQFTMRVRKVAYDTIVQEVGPFDNLITNQGLDRLYEGGSTYCFVGTNSSAPSVLNSQLGGYVNNTNTRISNSLTYGSQAEGYWAQRTVTWRFGQGGAAGNLSEVGIGWLISSAGGLTEEQRHRVFSRALIVDSNNVPVTITVLADEYLEVTYSLRHYPYIGADVTRTLSIAGTTYEYTMRPSGLVDSNTHVIDFQGDMDKNEANTAFFNAYTGKAAETPPTLSAVTASSMLTPGPALAPGSVVRGTYTPGSFTKTHTITWGLSQGNGTWGIRGQYFGTGGNVSSPSLKSRWQSTLDQPIPKDDTKVLSMKMSFSWGRYTP